jgi:hypothetical protein
VTQVRIIYSDEPGKVMPEHKGKIFAVIGPFEAHSDKLALQQALEAAVHEYNSWRSGHETAG